MKNVWNLRAFLTKFGKKNSGATAIEFAIVAMPFIALMFAIFDVALVYFSSSALEAGVAQAARQIRTGQAQTAGMTKEQFRQLICDNISALLSCDARLMIDVRRFTSFGAIATPPAVGGDGNFTGDEQFQAGSAGDIVVVRAFYAWPMLTPTGAIYSNMTGKARVISATTAFRNEPF